jgi:hypothetical protein
VLLLIIAPIRMLYVMLLYARHLSLFCHFSPFWRPLSRVLYYIPALRPIALLHIVWGPFNFPVIWTSSFPTRRIFFSPFFSFFFCFHFLDDTGRDPRLYSKNKVDDGIFFYIPLILFSAIYPNGWTRCAGPRIQWRPSRRPIIRVIAAA